MTNPGSLPHDRGIGRRLDTRKDRAPFIVVEGLDGSGTTTQAERLVASLHASGVRAVLTGEPTDSPVGKLIRNMVDSCDSVPSDTLALLFAADRSLHLYGEQGILERLDAGVWVICDRYLLSTFAYQTVDGVSTEDLIAYNRHAVDPDLTIFLDVEPEIGLSRVEERGTTSSRYESSASLAAVWRAYNDLRRAGSGLEHLEVVDGRDTKDEVEELVRSVVNKRFSHLL